MVRELSGGCLCGSVSYSVLDEFEYAMNCHCSQCRRATGSAFKPFAAIPREKLRLVRGEDLVMTFGDEPAHDVRCRNCGSFLYSIVRDGTYAHVAMGSLTDRPTIVPSRHIFVGSKADWHEIGDDLPQHPSFPS